MPPLGQLAGGARLGAQRAFSLRGQATAWHLPAPSDPLALPSHAGCSPPEPRTVPQAQYVGTPAAQASHLETLAGRRARAAACARNLQGSTQVHRTSPSRWGAWDQLRTTASSAAALLVQCHPWASWQVAPASARAARGLRIGQAAPPTPPPHPPCLPCPALPCRWHSI